MTAAKTHQGDKPVDPFDSLVGYQLRRASHALFGSLAEALVKHGLSVVEASVLVVIAESDGVTQSYIGRVLDIHRANMVPLAAKLAAKALTTCERNGRELVLRASPAGKRTARQVRAIMNKHDAAHFAGLERSQRDWLLATLRALWRDGRVAGGPGAASKARAAEKGGPARASEHRLAR